MSNLNVNSIYDASGGSNAVLYGVAAPANSMGFRNRIINGDMRIDQRNAGALYTPTGGAITYGSVDRWQFAASQASKFTVQRNSGSVTPPAGFTNYLGAVSLSAYSVAGSEQFNISQSIEGFNVADFAFGTANAVTVTLSFWVRSSLTGTFGGVLSNDGKNRTYPFTYTISAANTWEYKTVTVAGDTGGTWNTTTSNGLYVTFGLGVGSSASAAAGAWTGTANIYGATGATSVVGTNGATFYITGVQLEAGSVASPFERRDYGRELIMCQRYCFVLAPSETNIRAATSGNYGGTTGYVTTYLPVSLRGSISVTVSSVSDFKTEELDGGQQTTTAIGLNAGNGNTPITLSVTVGSSLANPVNLLTGNTSAKITYSSEL